jgi:hypothetical protein
MAGGWGFQEQSFAQAFLPDSDAHLFPGDGVPIFNVPNEAVDSTLDTGGLGNDYNYAIPPPSVLSYVSPDVRDGDVMLATATPASPSTHEVDSMPELVIQSHLSPPRITYPETNYVNVQEAPVAQGHREVPDEVVQDSDMTGLVFPTRTRYPTAEDWERHRPLFTRLYRDENKSLRKVRSIMKQKYGFNAT